MRILLDECVPRALARELLGHEVRTVQRMLWSRFRNGELLRLAAREFDVFLTVDKSIEYQHIPPRNLALITVVSVSTKLETLRPLVPVILSTLASIQPGDSVRIRA